MLTIAKEKSLNAILNLSSPVYHILFLTRWYPHQDDPQLGVFIRKHANAVSLYCNVSVLNVRAVADLKSNFEINSNATGNLSETVVQFKPSANRIVNFIRNAKAHFMGFNTIKKSKGMPDIMHTHVMYGLCLMTLILHFFKQVPYMISEHWHGFVDDKFVRKNFLFKALLHFTASNAKAITAVSAFLKQGMIANGFASTIQVVPNVVEGLSQQNTKRSDELMLLTVADLVDEIKNVSAVINALAELIKEKNMDINYHIIGGGKDEMQLRQLAADEGLLDTHIFFHGLRDNNYVLNFLSQIDFVIINSRYETFSIIAAEALLYGKPLLCTKCGGINDFVDADCGLLIEPDNNAQLKEALVLMMANYKNYDPSLLKQKVENRFSSATVGSQFYNIYKAILSKK